MNQTVEFLSSQRGGFIRDKLVDEVVNGLDAVGKNLLHNFTSLLRQKFGLTAVNEVAGATVEQQQTLEHIQQIVGILQQTRGFDPSKLAPQLMEILVNPKVHHLGQQIAGRFTQKARLIRQLLMSETTP
jgi:hypothetical protein